MMIDTHCHIHDSEFLQKYSVNPDELLHSAQLAGVEKVICVGTSIKSSKEAVAFVATRTDCYASIALHPHEVSDYADDELDEAVQTLELIAQTHPERLVAVGECGLDYFYHSDSKVQMRQQALFRRHIELALRYQLPLIFHIRDAFEDFFKIIDDYKGITGVVHSFSADVNALKGVVERGLYVGLNGIMTFSKQTDQLQAAKMVPLEKLVLETDAPFLTPAPFRGKMCEPKHVGITAQFLSNLRGETLEELRSKTTANARTLFGL